MGAIGGMFGLSGGASGTGFGNAQQAPIQQAVSPEQLAQAAATNTSAIDQQRALINAISAQGGIQNQSDVFNSLKGVADGTGPNPAQAMLNQQTGTNVANQAALMAGQRGASANSGLMARQAAIQGGNLQQQAVGQGATMQANQSLNALGQMSGIAGNQVANQMSAQNAYASSAGNQQANLLNALGQQNQANVSSQSSVNAANSGLAQTGMQGQQKLIGGAFNGASAAMGGGMPFADGGQVQNGPQSSFGQYLHSMSNGGMVDVVLSPGEKVVAPDQVNEAAGGSVKAKTVPGEAKVNGDSIKNDTYKTKLPEGSIVVPRTKAGSDKSAAEFVRRVLAQKGRKK